MLIFVLQHDAFKFGHFNSMINDSINVSELQLIRKKKDVSISSSETASIFKDFQSQLSYVFF